MLAETLPLKIGSLLFENLDQIDLTGPFEVLSRIPNATHRLYAKSSEPVRDVMGLKLAPDATLAEAPQLDILHIPGGPGQEALMEDEEVLGWLSAQAQGARKVFSVCTGALLCGAAGLLRGKRATTHWASLHLLPWFGAVPVDERVVIDGDWVFAAGVTAGIDGALRLAAEIRGEAIAQRIQLAIALCARAAVSERDAADGAARNPGSGAARRGRADRAARSKRPPGGEETGRRAGSLRGGSRRSVPAPSAAAGAQPPAKRQRLFERVSAGLSERAPIDRTSRPAGPAWGLKKSRLRTAT